MATFVNGSDGLVNGYGTPVCRAQLGYVKSAETATQVSYTLGVYIYCIRYGYTTSGVLSAALSCSGQSSKSVSGMGCDIDPDQRAQLIANTVYTFNKTTSAWTPTIGFSCASTGSSVHGTSTGTFKPTIPALQSYAVTYNANGGTGTLDPGTKYYGQDLTLSSGVGLTRPHYTLKGWNTAADGSGTHYDLGGLYTANEAITLYAEWELDAIVTKCKVNGAWQEGIIYAKVNGEWVIPYVGYVKVNGEWKEIEV